MFCASIAISLATSLATRIATSLATRIATSPVTSPVTSQFPPAEVSFTLQELYDFMNSAGVQDSFYLFERGWFCRSQELRDLVVSVIHAGKANKIIVIAGDFREHLEELLRE